MNEEEKAASRAAVIDYWWSQWGDGMVITVEEVPGYGRKAFLYLATRTAELGGNPRFPQVASLAAAIAVSAPPPTGMADIFDPDWNVYAP